MGSANENEAFVIAVARALHAYGQPAHRLEALLEALSEPLGTRGQYFCTPTAVFVAFGDPPSQRTYLVRSEAGEQDLSKLADLDALVSAVGRGELDATAGTEKLAAIVGRASQGSVLMRVLVHPLVAAPAALLLGGGPLEAAVAGGIGLLVGLLEWAAGRAEPIARLYLLLGSVVASVTAALAGMFMPDLAIQLATVAGIYMLMPGLSLTTAMNEVATGHLVSGTARFAGALVSFLSIAVGVSLGGALIASLSRSAALPGTLPPRAAFWPFIGLLVALPAVMVLLRAQLRDALPTFLVATCAFSAGQLSTPLFGDALGPSLAATVSALVLGLGSNAFARITDRPAALVMVPGILLLVPGTMGFRSVTSFLRRDVIAAVDTAFAVGLVAGALVTGLLIANLILPPRKAL
ncbi:MAG: threonine/serine exporter family protein [Sandaracinaceae bacterium]|nr:threonine/serine exporter family protein [Sandaracinaceae bacterium]